MIRIIAIVVAGLGYLAMSGCDPVAHRHRDAGEHIHSRTQSLATAHDHTHAPGGSQGQVSVLAAEQEHALLQPAHDPNALCECDSARGLNRWCRRCNIGYVAAVPIESGMLFSTLDPHGHDLDLGAVRCDQCRFALGADGFCDSCGMGFVRGMAYFSRLTHGLATGRAIDPEALRCDACRENSGGTGWCDRCSRGMVGNTAIFNRETFDRTAQEYHTLIAAIEKTVECELCASAMVVHRTCPACLISYGPESPGQSENDSKKKAPLGVSSL